ncbi:LysR family transcriptional regulator [Asaia spathodeae]|uniref:LysR family transcriptional regulator n=1 Tax=Asaia spathodeae TaxID=657016 RepID=A0ABX2P2L0_9PROT|nr:LysR family transcriptional regulator [Asaia spathodeae]GBR17792.1 putative transcriptional regulator [Asaia spathodeae NBRC 105894]
MNIEGFDIEPHSAMKNMKLRYFRVIEEIFNAQSLVGASSKLNLTPTAVSKACLEVENILGVKLFTRSNSGMMPTEICQSIVETSRIIKAELEKLAHKVNEFKEIRTGTVNIGFQAPALEKRIMSGIAQLKTKDAALKIRIVYRERPYLLDMLESGELDFAFVDFFQLNQNKSLDMSVMHRDNCFAASRESSMSIPELLEGWEENRKKLWILPVRGVALRERFDATLSARDLQPPNNIIEYNSSVGLEDLFVCTNGWGILPLYAVPVIEKYIILNDHYDMLEEMRLESGLVWMKNHTRTPHIEEAIGMFLNDHPDQ